MNQIYKKQWHFIGKLILLLSRKTASVNTENLFPSFDRLVSRNQKENLIRQKGFVVWITGLSGSGKTTLAAHTENIFFEKGYLTQVLDGDNIRYGLNKGLSFSEADRRENIRRIAEVAKLFKDAGVITFCACVCPMNEYNLLAREIIGTEDFVHVFLDTPLEECERRDVKGLYAKARSGEVQNFTGVTAPFEVPQSAELFLNTQQISIADSSLKLYDFLNDHFNLK